MRKCNDQGIRSAVGQAAAMIACSAALAGCGDIERLKVAADPRIVGIISSKPIDSRANGVLIASLGVGRPTCSTGVFEIFYRPVDGSLPQMSLDAVVSNMFGTSNGVMKLPNACLELVGNSLPPGRYQITGWKYFFDAGTASTRVASTQPLSIPFEIRPGEVTYLGSFQMTFIFGKNLFGRDVLAGGKFVVGDDLERDRSKLYELRTDLNGLPIVEQLPPEDLAPDGFGRRQAAAAQ